MGDVGDHWREAREDRRFFNEHGHWPGQKICKNPDCKRPFWPRADWHRVCGKCAKERREKNAAEKGVNTCTSPRKPS